MRELARWTSATPCRATLKLRVAPGWGRVDSHLAQLAQEREADLLVVGNHQRNLVERVWHGSISRSAIHEASCSVLCVPQRSLPAVVATPPAVVVVPLDFSALADRAVGIGYSLLGANGVLHLVHVGDPATANERDAQRAKLEARIPAEAATRGIRTEPHVLEGGTPWLAIWQYASRAGADLICMSTHTKDAIKSLVLGSQAQALVQHSRIPVVLVPPDRES
jgi:nucleotide-binding universal stress UspA family protein